MNLRLVGIALLSLTLGALVYVIDRPAGNLWPITDQVSLAASTPRLFGSMGGILPAFIHVYAFSLLTAAIAGGSRRTALVVCATWGGIDCLFEIGQATMVSEFVGSALGNAAHDSALAGAFLGYWQNGVFDPLDLLAICFGALAAWFTICPQVLFQHTASAVTQSVPVTPEETAS